MPEGDRYELIGGQLVERQIGWEASRIGGRLFGYLFQFCEQHQTGWVAPADASYQCFPDEPSKVRRPDGSFICASRLPATQEPEGHCRIAPDLVVEVVSPHDLYSDVEAKVDDYLRAGTSLVWVIDPRTRSVRIHRADGTVSDLHREADQLDGESVLPGFRCPIGNLFLTPLDDASQPHG